MYNRYIRNENGGYERIRQMEPTPPTVAPPPPPPPHSHRPEPPPFLPPPSPPLPPPEKGLLDGLLNRFHLENIDTGDLLLLAILFLLFRQDADEEALIALGLLLIL